MDFMGDTLDNGRTSRVFNVLDEGHREALAIEIDASLPSVRMQAVLQQLITLYGTPRRLRCDHGPECIAERLRDWCAVHDIQLQFMQPDRPNQKAYIERCNRSVRTEILSAWVLTSLTQVRELSEAWRIVYNTERPHQSVGDAPPSTFLPRTTHPGVSSFKLCA